jgi:hypothetical protein
MTVRRKNESLEAVTAELRAAGISYQVEQGSKHLKIKWSRDGRNEMSIVSIVGSGYWHAHKKARADVRRKLRA